MNEVNQSEALSTLWGEHIKRWQKTELSQSAYCHEQDLNYHRFTYWRRKLSGQAKRKKQLIEPAAFIQVQPHAPSRVAEELRLTFSNGMTLQGITSSNILVVKQLLNVLS